MTDANVLPENPEMLRAINHLYSRYCWAMDRPDADALVECFTPDGVLTIGSREFRGERGLRELLAGRDGTSPRHHYDNLLLDQVSPDVVRARAYFTLLGRDGNVAGLGTYDDELAFDPQAGWRWTSKAVNFEWRA